MARRLVPALLVVGALALTASLFLPRQGTTCPSFNSFQAGRRSARLRNLLLGCPRFDGFSTGVGAPAGLCALLIVTLPAACLARPRSSFGAMLGQSALSTAYFGIAVGVRAPLGAAHESRILQQHFHYAYGTYVGLAGTALLLVLAWATPLRAHISRTPANVAALVLAGALLVAVLLPWLRYDRSMLVVLPAAVLALASLDAAVCGRCTFQRSFGSTGSRKEFAKFS